MSSLYEDDFAEAEWIDDEDEEDDADDLLVCPSCHAAIHEDTQKCPHCGDWIVPADPAGQRRRTAMALVVFLLVLAIVLTYVL